MINAKTGVFLAPLLLLTALLYAAPPEFQIDLKELERQKPAPAKASPRKAPQSRKQAPAKKEAPRKAPAAGKASSVEAGQGEYVRYTVRPGDHIFKILMIRFGLSNEQAERLIPSIVGVNGIRNIKALEVGRTLLIPAAALHGREPKAGKENAKEPAKEVRDGTQAEPHNAPQPAASESSKTPEPAAEPPRAPEPSTATPEAPPAKAPPVPAPTPAPAPDASPSK